MSQESQPTGDNAAQARRKRPEWVTLLVFPVIVAVLGAVLVAAFTPLGTSARELLFHTRATVAGSVTVDGKPAVNAQLKLDGADRGNTDVGGRFLLTEVGKGQHRLHLELVGAKPRDEVFSVAAGQTALQVGNVEMEPLVRLGYAASLQMPLLTQRVDYDITLWIIADSDVLSRIKSVSYTLPVPLSTRPVSGASATQAFCYRQTGSLSLQNLPLGNSAFALASAVVDLGGGKKFHISAPSGKTQPPDCPAQQAGQAGQPGQPGPTPTTPTPTQQRSPSPGQQPVSSPTPPAQPLTDVPRVIGEQVQAAAQLLHDAGFSVSIMMTPGSASVPPGTVLGRQPSDASLPRGSEITIFVQSPSSPPPPTSSPTPTPSQKGG